MSHSWPVPQAGPFAVSATNQRDGIILPSAVYVYNTNLFGLGNGVIISPEYTNLNAIGLRIYVDITDNNGGTVTVKLQNRDPASLNWVDIPLATTAGLGTNATTTLTIAPGIAETTNVDVADPLGIRWRVVATVATASMTFSVGGDYLV